MAGLLHGSSLSRAHGAGGSGAGLRGAGELQAGDHRRGGPGAVLPQHQSQCEEEKSDQGFGEIVRREKGGGERERARAMMGVGMARVFVCRHYDLGRRRFCCQLLSNPL